MLKILRLHNADKESKFAEQILTPSSSLVRTQAFQAWCAGSNPAGVVLRI